MEIELRALADGEGQPLSSRVWIDNWDPEIKCSYYCGDFDKTNSVTGADYLLLLSEMAQGKPSSKQCLDLNGNGYVGLSDLLAWDSYVSGHLLGCWNDFGAPLGRMGEPPAREGPACSGYGLIVAGKRATPNSYGLRDDALFTVDPGGATTRRQDPAGTPGSRGYQEHGRLVRDTRNNVYQIHGTQGLVRLCDGATLVPPLAGLHPTAQTLAGSVTIGINWDAWNEEYFGLPLSDAVFSPEDQSVVYVVPVQVLLDNGDWCTAAAKLQLTPGGSQPYNLLRLYSPWQPVGNPLPVQNFQHLSEIEIDKEGQSLFVACGYSSNQNDWVLIYDVASGAEKRVSLSAVLPAGPSPAGPTALLVSTMQNDKLYVAESAALMSADCDNNGVVDTDDILANPSLDCNNDGLLDACQSAQGKKSRLYRFTIGDGTNGCDSELLCRDGYIEIDQPVTGEHGAGYFRLGTAVTEDPRMGAIYVTSVAAPRYCTADSLPADGNFTTATVATVPVNTPWSLTSPQTLQAETITAQDPSLEMLLPVSAVFVPFAGDFDQDGYVDLDDFTAFRQCVSGPGIAAAGDCAKADFDRDNDVDMNDFGVFQRCFSGTTLADPDCAH